MFYTYYELSDCNQKDEYVIELSFDNPIEINTAEIKIYGLNIYYISKDGKVNYPMVYDGVINFDNIMHPLNTNMNEYIIKNISEPEYIFDWTLDDLFCNEIVFDEKKFHDESVIDKVCEYQALNSIACIYDVNTENYDSWIIRRNGQVVGSFNPNEYEKYYDPEYDGDDRYLYLGDAIIVAHISPDNYASNRIQTNYLSFKLHNLGVLWLLDHGYKAPKYNIQQKK